MEILSEVVLFGDGNEPINAVPDLVYSGLFTAFGKEFSTIEEAMAHLADLPPPPDRAPTTYGFETIQDVLTFLSQYPVDGVSGNVFDGALSFSSPQAMAEFVMQVQAEKTLVSPLDYLGFETLANLTAFTVDLGITFTVVDAKTIRFESIDDRQKFELAEGVRRLELLDKINQVNRVINDAATTRDPDFSFSRLEYINPVATVDNHIFLTDCDFLFSVVGDTYQRAILVNFSEGYSVVNGSFVSDAFLSATFTGEYGNLLLNSIGEFTYTTKAAAGLIPAIFLYNSREESFTIPHKSNGTVYHLKIKLLRDVHNVYTSDYFYQIATTAGVANDFIASYAESLKLEEYLRQKAIEEQVRLREINLLKDYGLMERTVLFYESGFNGWMEISGNLKVSWYAHYNNNYWASQNSDSTIPHNMTCSPFSQAGMYGTVTLDAYGHYTYMLTSANDLLPAQGYDTFATNWSDGAITHSKPLAIEIKKKDPSMLPASFTTAYTAGINQTDKTASGDLNLDVFGMAETNLTGLYGTLNVSARGYWQYTRNLSLMPTQSVLLVDTFLITKSASQPFYSDLAQTGNLSPEQKFSVQITTAYSTQFWLVNANSFYVHSTFRSKTEIVTLSGVMQSNAVYGTLTYGVQSNVPKTHGMFSITSSGNWTYVIDPTMLSGYGTITQDDISVSLLVNGDTVSTVALIKFRLSDKTISAGWGVEEFLLETSQISSGQILNAPVVFLQNGVNTYSGFYTLDTSSVLYTPVYIAFPALNLTSLDSKGNSYTLQLEVLDGAGAAVFSAYNRNIKVTLPTQYYQNCDFELIEFVCDVLVYEPTGAVISNAPVYASRVIPGVFKLSYQLVNKQLKLNLTATTISLIEKSPVIKTGEAAIYAFRLTGIDPLAGYYTNNVYSSVQKYEGISGYSNLLDLTISGIYGDLHIYESYFFDPPYNNGDYSSVADVDRMSNTNNSDGSWEYLFINANSSGYYFRTTLTPAVRVSYTKKGDWTSFVRGTTYTDSFDVGGIPVVVNIAGFTETSVISPVSGYTEQMMSIALITGQAKIYYFPNSNFGAQHMVSGYVTATNTDMTPVFVVQDKVDYGVGEFSVGLDGYYLFREYRADYKPEKLFSRPSLTTPLFLPIQTVDGGLLTLAICINSTTICIPYNYAIPVNTFGTQTLLETGGYVISGVLTFSDPDAPNTNYKCYATYANQNSDELSLTFGGDGYAIKPGLYGEFKINASGQWNYTVAPAYQELAGGASLLDGLHCRATSTGSAVGNSSSIFTLTVNLLGVDDVAQITSSLISRTITESNSVQSVVGNLTVLDPDSVTVQVPAATKSGTYGTFSYTSSGFASPVVGTVGMVEWIYTMYSPMDYLAEGEIRVDTCNITNSTGTIIAPLTVSITGTNDLSVLSSQAKTDYAKTDFQSSGVLTVQDLDTPTTFVAQANTVGTYGAFSITNLGVWGYTATLNMGVSQSGALHTDSFDVFASDGVKTTVTVNILDDSVIFEPYTLLTANKLKGVTIDTTTPSAEMYLVATSSTNAEWKTL